MLHGTLTAEERDDKLLLTLNNGETQLIRAKARRRKKLTEELFGRPITVALWPSRIKEDGTLHGSQLATWDTNSENVNHLNVTGRLTHVNRDKRIAVVLIRPNQHASPHKPFTVSVQVDAATMDAVPDPLPRTLKPDRGIRFTGSLQNGKLTADAFTLVRLAPAKPEH